VIFAYCCENNEEKIVDFSIVNFDLSFMVDRFQKIVRIGNKNLDGMKKVSYALLGIKGICNRLADIIVKLMKIDKDRRLGFLSDNEIDKLNNLFNDLKDYKIPKWLFNRNKDRRTGENLHLLEADLDLQLKSDIDLMKEIKSWKGYRHSYGLKVRGQKTKSTGRKRRAVGVKKSQLTKRL
jgi:small subunit ribosomal protein S13